MHVGWKQHGKSPAAPSHFKFAAGFSGPRSRIPNPNLQTLGTENRDLHQVPNESHHPSRTSIACANVEPFLESSQSYLIAKFFNVHTAHRLATTKTTTENKSTLHSQFLEPYARSSPLDPL
eukprot:scaffold105936_cov17-Tisochrysis_lutea.AAC.1